MSPLVKDDTIIDIYPSKKLYEAGKNEPPDLVSEKKLNIFQCLYDKFRKWLTADGLFSWNWKYDFVGNLKIPFFIIFISILEVVVYLTADERMKEILLYDASNKKEIWRFLTYMLLHTDTIHLILNILIQGLLGTPLELEQGPLQCAGIYFGGGLAGSLGAFAFSTFPLMAGASGGVYSLLTSQIPNVVLNYGTIKHAGYRIIGVVVLIVSDVIYIFCHVYLFNNERPRIGWVAHASGAAAGILLGFLLFNGSSKWKRKFRMTSCVILVLPSLIAGGFALAKFAFSL